jgi:hypothetical protein
MAFSAAASRGVTGSGSTFDEKERGGGVEEEVAELRQEGG